ncbi:MAG TPA: hypothetical protein VFI20_03240 [Terracidiphilus sp.]|nr:hypothetical protein [Terracidiphilus sp.]
MVPLVLIAAVLVMTVGAVCHTHTNCSPGTCPFCHLVIAPSMAANPADVMIPIGEGPQPQSLDLVIGAVHRQIPARAPPA